MIGEKTIVLGLDGGHFELIEPWIDAGELPNIERAREGGVSADMQSVLPPVTSPNWKAYATGKNPGQFGIFWWENVDMEERRVYYPDDRKAAHPEFWEIIGDQSSAGVVNVPTTYPPREVEPFIVAGAPDADSSGYTHPPAIEEELEDQLEYTVTKNTAIKNRPDEAADEIVELIDLRFKAGKYLLDQYDPEFLQITTFYLNSLHHFFWDDEKTLKGWKVVDDHLGDFLDQEYNVVLMGDHGATEIETVFHINAWLERQGFLASDMGISETLGGLGITGERLIEITTKLGVRGLAKRVAPQWVLDQIPSEEGEVQRESKTANLDWKKTTALASGQGPVYIDNSAPEYERIRTELIDRLSELTGPNGTKIADQVYRGEEVYDGDYADEAPDIVIDQTNGVHIQGGLGRDEIFSNPRDDGWRGENKRDAMFVAIGPDFSSGSVDYLSILDLAPTLLHLHGCEIPVNFDGHVRNEIYADNGDSVKNPVSYSDSRGSEIGVTSSIENDESVRDRLQDLGYLE